MKGYSGGNGFQTSAYDAFLTLRDDIIEGRRAPGQRLVRRALASELGMSPIPVMEALLRLEQEGLVESAPMYGARVREITIQGLTNEQAYREAIECQTARYCAESANRKQIEDLYEKAEPLDLLMASGDSNSREGRRRHLEFHLTIARYSGYPLLEKRLETAGFLELMRVNWVNAVVFSVPAGWHKQLVDAISTGDAAVAEAKMRQHVRYNVERQIEALKQVLESAKAGSKREAKTLPPVA